MKADSKSHRLKAGATLAAVFSVVRMGLIWAVGWGLIGVLIAFFVDPNESIEDMWVWTLAFPGFVSGVVFSIVIRIAERRRRFAELSLPRLAAWGTATGLLLGALPFVLGSPSSRFPMWMVIALITGSMTLLSAISAVGSALLLRLFARKRAQAGAESDE